MDKGEHCKTEGAEPRRRTTIATAIPALRLVALAPNDAKAYYELVDRNRTHLTSMETGRILETLHRNSYRRV